ncbi:hypothetical protein [Actinomadura sp. NTSP31]|uniref:hypothetical protein n=1 Tax=Actinomadura sp. NTSP31 TaxID=1735447 RepID=UPI0035BFBADA
MGVVEDHAVGGQDDLAAQLHDAGAEAQSAGDGHDRDAPSAVAPKLDQARSTITASSF